MDYYTYGNLNITTKMFQSIAMMTGGNSSFESLMIATSMLAFLVILGVTVFKQTFVPMSSWFLGLLLVWYGMMIPKIDVIIVDQTNAASNRVVSNLPLGIGIIGNITSSMGKWFTDKAEIVFTGINDTNYSSTGLVFGANAFKEARRINMLNYNPELQSDWTQFASNCSFYDIAKYNKYSVSDMQNSTDLLTLMGNTNQALMTSVGGVTMFCDQAYTNLKSKTDDLVNSQNFLQRFATALNPSGFSNSSMPAQATQTMLGSLETAYSNMFAGVQRDAVGIITQEMMINTIKTAALQNAQTTGDTEQMMAGIASAQAELQIVNSQNTVATLASKYLPIMHNVIEGIIIALFPMMIVMCVLGGWAMFQVVMAYVSTLLWVKLWPGMFAIVNGISNMVQANNSISASFGSGGTTLNNSLDMLSTANSTQAFAGWMAILVPAISWGIIKLGNMGLQSALSSVTSGAQKAGEATGGAVGAGNINVGNSSYNNTSANKNDRSAMFKDPGVARVETSTGWYQGASSQDSMRAGMIKNDLPVTANSNYQRALEASQAASASMERAHGLAATSEQSRQAAINSGLEYLSSSGIQNASSIMLSDSSSAQNKSSWQKVAQIGSQLDQKYGLKDGTSTSNILNSKADASLGLGTSGASGRVGAGFGVLNQGKTSQDYSRDLTSAKNSLQKEGVSFDASLVDALQKNQQFQRALSHGDSTAQRTVSSMAESNAAKIAATDSYKESQSYTNQSRELYSQSQSIGIDQNKQVGDAFLKGQTALADIGSSKGASQLASGVAQTDAPNPNFVGSRFEPPSDTIDIKPVSGGKEGVVQSYNQAKEQVGSANISNNSQVQSSINSVGLGNVGNQIQNSESTLSAAFDKAHSQNSDSIQAANQNVSTQSNNMKAGFTNAASNPSMGQKFTNWANGNSTVFDEIKRGVGADFATNQSDGIDRTQDPKPSAPTVFINNNQSRWRK